MASPIPLYYPNRMFLPLDPPEMQRLRDDEDLWEVYIDSLALMHDLLCGFAAARVRPRFGDAEEVSEGFDAVIDRGGRAAKADEPARAIVETMAENIHRARMLHREISHAPPQAADRIRGEVERFVDAILAQFLMLQ